MSSGVASRSCSRHELRLERVAGLGLLVGQRVASPASRGCCCPRRAVGLTSTPPPSSVRAPSTSSSITSRQSPTIGTSGRRTLPELGRVDVDVDDLGLGGEARHPAGHPVVEAAAQGDEQVRLLHRRDRGVVAVHARHAQARADGSSGNAPRAISVVTTWTSISSASSRSASAARALRMPPPA